MVDKRYVNCTLKEYNFYRSRLQECIFVNCDLSESNFSKARIEHCTFINCFMQFCAMTSVQIYNCQFKNCDLWHSNLCHSTVKNSIFNQCILRALYKDLNWQNNIFDEETIIESCGGGNCRMSNEIVKNLKVVSNL